MTRLTTLEDIGLLPKAIEYAGETFMFNPKIGEYRMPTFVRKTFEDALNDCLDFLYLADGLVRY